MQKETLSEPITIIGLELRTDNDRAMQDIPSFWQNACQGGEFNKIQNKLSQEMYAVYTNFENEGVNSKGTYSMVIGYPVAPTEIAPEGMVKITLPKSDYMVFPLENGRRDQVGVKWVEVWKLCESDPEFNKKRTYTADFERYKESGEIDIYLGVKSEG